MTGEAPRTEPPTPTPARFPTPGGRARKFDKDRLGKTPDEGASRVAIHPLELVRVAPILAAALFGEWHHRHEELAQALQRLRDPASVDALFRAATQVLAYKYDDGAAFARKCTWALADIGTDDARDRLRDLAMQPEPLGAYAQRRLDCWADELDRKGPVR